MGNFLDLTKSRRSIRFYDKREIKRAALDLCIEAARQAPSACNSQPWKFIVIDDPAAKRAIAESLSQGAYTMNTFAREATAFIAIVSESMKFPAWAGSKILNMDYRRIDIGLASAHLVLQAQELGIGTCILGWFNEKKIKKLLKVPRAKRIELVIALGYPGDYTLKKKKLKDKKEVLSFNSYEG